MMIKFRVLAFLEGISYLALFPTVILKYVYEMGFPNKIVGTIHGILFIFYCIWAIRLANKKGWSVKKTLIVLSASLIPFATFILEYKMLRYET